VGFTTKRLVRRILPSGHSRRMLNVVGDLVDSVQDRFKNHGYTAVSHEGLRGEDF
jgi:hypothetical protein